MAICEENGVEYIELQVANDALTVVVNPENDWATCLTVDELNAIWKPGSTVSSWQDVRSSFPDESLELFGPGTDSGTFDYFTDAINGEEGRKPHRLPGIRGRQRDRPGRQRHARRHGLLRVLVLRGEPGALEGGRDRRRLGVRRAELRMLRRPATTTRSRGRSSSTRRPTALERQEVEDFLRYMLDNESTIAETAQFVPLNQMQIDENLAKLDEATGT